MYRLMYYGKRLNHFPFISLSQLFASNGPKRSLLGSNKLSVQSEKLKIIRTDTSSMLLHLLGRSAFMLMSIRTDL